MNSYDPRKQRALVTGASSGIGLELARELAKNGHPLVITATKESVLQELAGILGSEYGVEVRYIAIDLQTSGSAEQLYESLKSQGISIDILVNNAGIGRKGPFLKQSLESQLAIVRLNIETVLGLTHCFLPEMVSRGYGRILNTASIAGYIPGPTMAVYHATKAFLLSFNSALASELWGSGVTVTALCPGATDTRFFTRALASSSLAFQKGHVMAPQDVAVAGYKALMQGERTHIPGRLNQWMIFARRLLPESFLTAMSGIFYKDVRPLQHTRRVGEVAAKRAAEFT